MKHRDTFYWACLFLLGALLFCVPPAHGATSCTTVNNRAIVYPSTTQVYQQQAQQTYQQNYQAVAVAVPLYSASAPGLSPEVILLLQQITESMKQTNALLEAHESRLAAVEHSNYVLPSPPGIQQAPRARRQQVEPQQQPEQPPEMPPAVVNRQQQQQSVASGVPKLFATACAKCHDSSVATAKGGGLALMSAGRELPLTCYQMLEIQDRVTMDPSDPDYMPKGGKAEPEDVDQVVDHLKQLAKARK